MTIDLWCLLTLVLWSIPLNHMPAIGRILAGGLKWAMSNRETLPDTAPWVGRAERAQRNHHDNLAMIGAVILIGQVTGELDPITGWAAVAIVGFRFLHSLAYIAGISVLRSLGYAGSLGGLFVVVWRIVT